MEEEGDGMGGEEKEGRVGGRGKRKEGRGKGEDVEGPGKCSAPGPVLAHGGCGGGRRGEEGKKRGTGRRGQLRPPS